MINARCEILFVALAAPLAWTLPGVALWGHEQASQSAITSDEDRDGGRKESDEVEPARAPDRMPAGPALLDFVRTLTPSVVTVVMTDEAGRIVSSGTGFYLTGDVVVTDRRVPLAGTRGRVELETGEIRLVENVLAQKENINLVLLGVKAPRHKNPSRIEPVVASSQPPRSDDEILLISNPVDRDQPAVAKGKVTAVGEVDDLGQVIHLDVPPLPGSSGSPVFSSRGDVVGVAMAIRAGGESRTFAIPIERVLALKSDDETADAMSLADFREKYGALAGPGAHEAEEDPALRIEATFVKREDASLIVDDQFIVKGSGSREDPYRITWELLISAVKVYRPREGKTDLPERVTFLNDKWVKLTGYVAFPLMARESEELHLMLNQWDGCCIGVPPTPYDAVEVYLRSPIDANAGVNVFNYGTVVGRFKVDPYVVNNWLVGLYVMEDATLDLEW